MCCFGLCTPFVDWLVPPIIGGWFYIPIVHRPRLVVVVYTSIVECLHRYCISNPGWFIAASAGETQQTSTPLLLTSEETHVTVIPISEPQCLTLIVALTFHLCGYNTL